MVIRIEFFPGLIENTLPMIRLTRSRNGQTGTATFLFIQPRIFERVQWEGVGIESISLLSKKGKIVSTDITSCFKEGKPFLIKAIFLFKNSTEWFAFLTFMQEYSEETGLSFLEK